MKSRNLSTMRPYHHSFRRNHISPTRPIFIGIALFSGGVASAQESVDQTVEEIIVTATKRDEPLERVPASISVLGASDLAVRQIQTIEALTHNVPNVAYTMVAAVVPNFSIRGVSPDGGSPLMEGTVALHIDGVYQPRANMLELALADLQSAEILRGPQGTLYGRNANAGVISLTTRRPTNEFEASITGVAGSYNRYGLRGYVSGPLTPRLSFRVFGMFDQSDGYGRNLLLGTAVSGYENVGARASLRWEPTDDLTVEAIGSYSRSVSSQPFYTGNPFGMQAGSNFNRLLASGADGRFSLEPYEVYNSFDPRQMAHQKAGTVAVDWQLGRNLSLRSITGYQDYDYRSLQDHDGTPTNWIVTAALADSTTFSQEVNVNAALGRATIVAGVYYLDDDLDGGNVIEIPRGNPFGSDATPGLLTSTRLTQRSVSKAVFADVTYAISRRLRILAGLRRTNDQRETVQRIEAAINGSFSDPGTPITGCTLNHPVPDVTFNSTTGKVGAQFDIAPKVTSYVTWQTGFKAGGYSPNVCDNQFLPEKVSSWEAGVKGYYFDDALRLNLSAFHYDYANMQLLRTYNPTPTTISAIIDNAASAKLWGGEMEAVATLSHAWRADLAIGYVHSEYGPLEARNGAAGGNPNVILTGNRLPRSPKWTVVGGIEYKTDLARLGRLMIRAQYNYTSKIYFTPFNEPIAQQGGYGLFDLTATFEPANTNLAIRLFGRNLTDEAYFNGLFTSALTNNGRGSYGPPRTFGIELTTSF